MFVLSIISGGKIPEAFETQVNKLIAEHGVVASNARSLSDSALELTLDQYPEALKTQLFALSTESKIDLIVQKAQFQNKKLVVFDMDSTLIQQEVIDLIAAHAGVEAQVSAITEAAMRGELDFTQSLQQRLALLKGVDVSVYDYLKTQIKLTPGAKELSAGLKANGVKMAVLSGGFIPLARWVQEQLGLDYAHANVLEDDGKVLTGNTIGTVVDGSRKAQLLQEIAHKEGIPLEYVVAVGDGSNDLPMMAKAGFGVAFNAKPLVQQKAPARLNTGNLADLLYVLGYN